MATAVVCAYSHVGAEALVGLLEAGVEVLRLYTYEQPAEDRWFTPPADIAAQHGIPVFMEPDFNADSVFEDVQQLQPDFLFSFYFREMIQERILTIAKRGSYNLHGSMLPKYRGRAPINWVLLHGEEETGITLHAMTPKPDDGDILAQERIPIAWDETPLSLTKRAASTGRGLLHTSIPKLLDGTIQRKSQREMGPSTYFGGRKPSDSRLILDMTVQEAFNQIRAVADPWPNAYFETSAGPIKVAWALPTALPCPQGHYRVTNEGVLLGFRDGALRLIALRKGNERSERPTEHAAWIKECGIPLVTGCEE